MTEAEMLTWGQYVAGEPCPGCGRPYRDEEEWDFRGTANFTDAERERYEAEEQRFKREHGKCRARVHSVFGSLTKQHCMKCCPSPPLSPEQVETIGRLLRSAGR